MIEHAEAKPVGQPSGKEPSNILLELSKMSNDLARGQEKSLLSNGSMEHVGI